MALITYDDCNPHLFLTRNVRKLGQQKPPERCTQSQGNDTKLQGEHAQLHASEALRLHSP